MEIRQETNSICCSLVSRDHLQLQGCWGNDFDGQGGESRCLRGQMMCPCSSAAPSSLSCLPPLSQKANCLFPIREGHRNCRHLVADSLKPLSHSGVSEGKNKTKLQCYYEVGFPICGKTQNLTNTVITVSVKIDKYFKGKKRTMGTTKWSLIHQFLSPSIFKEPFCRCRTCQ